MRLFLLCSALISSYQLRISSRTTKEEKSLGYTRITRRARE